MIPLDRSIVARFNPKGILLDCEYLCRQVELFSDHDWFWSKKRSEAHVFPTHAEAETKARTVHFTDARGHLHTAWALVVGSDPLYRDNAHLHPTPQEAFAELERRKLA